MLCRSLIGRRGELEVLHGALRLARHGEGSAHLIVGGPGLGKTRLLRELRAVSTISALGRCSPGGGTLRPFHEALMAASHPGSLDAVSAPLLRGFLGKPPLDAPLDSSSILVLADELLRAFSALAADDPMVISIDDLERAHPETLTVFEYIADHITSHPLLLVGALRDEPGPTLDMAERLRTRRSVAHIQLEPLSREETITMAAYCLDSSELARGMGETIWKRAEGIPFAVEELLQAAASRSLLKQVDERWEVEPSFADVLPVTIAESVRSRASALGRKGRKLLTHAAMLGRAFSLEALVDVLQMPLEDLREIIGAAVRSHLLEIENATEVRFRHALTRQAVLADMSSLERAHVAAALLDVANGGPSRLDPEVTYDLAIEAGRSDLAVATLVEVVTGRVREGAFDSARLALQRARSLGGEDGRAIARVEEVALDLDIAVGDMDQALVTGRRLLGALQQAAEDTAQIARARLRLARAAVSAGDRDLAQAQIALAEREGANEADLVAQRLLLRGEVAFTTEAFEDGEAAAHEALRYLSDPSLWQTRCEAWSLLGRCTRARSLDDALHVFEKVLEVAELHDSKPWRARALLELGSVELHRNGRTQRLEGARKQAIEIGAMATAAEIDLQSVFHLGTQFRLDEALIAAKRCSDLAERYRLGLLPLSLIQQAAIYAWMGDHARMEWFIEAATDLVGEDPTILSIAWGDCRGFAAMWRNDVGRAVDMLDRAVALPVSYETAAAPSRGLWALLKTVVDDDADGSRSTVRATEASDAWWNVALLHYADAIAAGRRGDGEGAEASVAAGDQAVRQQVNGDWVRHLGRRFVAASAIEQEWGDPETWLCSAQDFYDHTHPAFAAACRGLLRRMGVKVPRRGRGSSDVPVALKERKVTSREVDVLSLIAEGLANQEIADRLFLSPRTVEKHVASLLAKTQSRSRTQLSALYVSVSSPNTAPSPGA